MALKSALTASLASGAAAPSTTQPAVKKAMDFSGWAPCVAYADVLDGVTSEDSLVAAAEDMSLEEKFIPVGSAPTRDLLMPDGTPLVSLHRSMSWPLY